MKYERAWQLNQAQFRRRTGVNPETFAELEVVLHGRDANTGKSGRPPALPVGAQRLLTLEFWREDRTYFHLGQEWGLHETTVLRTVVRVEDALLQSGRFFPPGKKTLMDAGTVLTAVVVDVREVPCERPRKAGRPQTSPALPKTTERLIQREKKRHTLKLQLLIHPVTYRILCVATGLAARNDL